MPRFIACFCVELRSIVYLDIKPEMVRHLHHQLDVITTAVPRFGSRGDCQQNPRTQLNHYNAQQVYLIGGGGGCGPLHKKQQPNTLKTYLVADIQITAAQYIHHIQHII